MDLPEMALRFILSDPTVSTVIPGMRKVRHVERNLAASDGERIAARCERGAAQASLGSHPRHTVMAREPLTWPLASAMLGMLPSSILGRLRAWRVRQIVAAYAPASSSTRTATDRCASILETRSARGGTTMTGPSCLRYPRLRGTHAAARRARLRYRRTPGSGRHDARPRSGFVGLVLAVEPNPHNAAVALKNRDLNGMTQIEVLEAAVSDQSGTVVFNHGLDGQLDDGTGAGGRMSVACVTLDELRAAPRHAGFVMIDVEGAECRVLKGGSRVLQSGADFAVEVHVNHGLKSWADRSRSSCRSFRPTGSTSRRAPRRTLRFVRSPRRSAHAGPLLSAREAAPEVRSGIIRVSLKGVWS